MNDPSTTGRWLRSRRLGQLRSESRWIEPWYTVYAFKRAVKRGLIPILIPLLVSQTGEAVHIGVIMAAFSLGGFLAPLWGALADRFQIHRWLVIGGLGLAALSLALLPFVDLWTAQLTLAILVGTGGVAATTVANLFIVQRFPKDEWGTRIGWLHTVISVGGCAGLLLASVLTQFDLTLGLLVAAGLMLLGAGVGVLTIPRVPPKPGSPPAVKHLSWPMHWGMADVMDHAHHLTWSHIRQFGVYLRKRSPVFLVIWLFAIASSVSFMVLYPVLMEQVFGIDPGLSSLVFAVAVVINLATYPRAGYWSQSLGAPRMFWLALLIRMIIYGLIAILGLAPGQGQAWLALLAFIMLPASRPLIDISGTVLAVQMWPDDEGTSMGIFKAVTAVASSVGAIAGGWGGWAMGV